MTKRRPLGERRLSPHVQRLSHPPIRPRVPGKWRGSRMTLADVTLDDKYALQSGRIYLNGVQALVRLPLMQRQRDVAAGLDTGGFISGYRGSPLGGYDNALWAARKFLEKHRIKFQPGVNEDLAATSVWGSQMVNMYESATA